MVNATLHEDVDALYRAADSAVYRAKAAGRNRVCRDGPAAEWTGLAVDVSA